MSKSRICVILVVTLLLSLAGQTFAQTVAAKQDEGKLIATLKNSEASRQDKIDACRQLAIIGGKDSIAPLAALLGDEDLSHMARYALEPNPDPAVDQALRDALGKVKGKPLVGVIGSIGVRRDTKAVGLLAERLGDSDAAVACAAARALGSIGNAEAAEALQQALANVAEENKVGFCEGLLRCAESLAAAGERRTAIAIYDRLREMEGPHQVRAGALRGAILTRRRGRLSLLQEQLRSSDYILFSAAVQATHQMPNTRITKVLVDEMKGLSADNQIVVIQALGLRGDEAALPALSEAAQAGPKPVRIAALRAITELGDASSVPALVSLLDDSDRQIAQSARQNLGAFPGPEADAAVMTMFESSDADRQLMALDLMGRRRMTGSVPVLLKAARGGDAKVRPAAIKMVGELGGPKHVPALLDLLKSVDRSQDRAAVEQALAAVCTKADDSQSQAERLISELDRAEPAQKAVLIRVLGAIGGPKSLEAVRTAAGSSNAEVRSAAVRALSTWKTADAAGPLMALAKETNDPAEKTLFLRGYLNLAGRRDLPMGQRLAMCRQAADMIARDDEKRLLLGTLSNIESPEALSLIVPHLGDAAIRQEAALAAVTLSEKLLKGRNGRRHAAAVIESLEKVTQAEINDDMARRAKAVLRQARSRAGNN